MRIGIFKSLARWAVVAAACLLSTAFASAQELDFRGTSWGMTTAQVLDSENDAPIDSTTENLAYSVEVADLDAYALYYFIDDTLVTAGYLFAEEYSNDNMFIKDFEKVKNILQRKYGEPSEDLLHWSGDVYKDIEEFYAFAIRTGHLTMRAIWQIERTTISLVLYGDDYGIQHVVIYESIAHADLKEREEESGF